MSDPESDPELTQLLTDLTRTLRELEQEVEPERPPGPRLPTPRELSRFTSEVAIPGLILLLQTNIRALQLLQRTIRLASGENPTPDGAVTEARARAERVGRASLSQLEDVLTDLQSALESRPENGEADELLSRARQLREEVHEQIEQDGTGLSADETESVNEENRRETSDDRDVVNIDIESELQAIKDNVEDDPDTPEGSGDTGPGSDGDEGTGPESDGGGDTDSGSEEGEDTGSGSDDAGGNADNKRGDGSGGPDRSS